MIVLSSDFRIGSAFNMILNYGTKNFTPLKTMKEIQIKAISGYGSRVQPLFPGF